jgi:hypothetical protein
LSRVDTRVTHVREEVIEIAHTLIRRCHDCGDVRPRQTDGATMERGLIASKQSRCRILREANKVAPMTESSPNVIEIKLDRLIDDMRFLRSQMIAFDRRLNGIEAYLKPSEQQPESKSTPWFAAAGRAPARTALFAVGAAVGAALLYLGT